MLDEQVRSDLAAGKYAFIDAGCASGGSIRHCELRFGRGPGLGLDWYGGDLEVARRAGFAVAECDLMSEDLPEKSVAFASMMDYLEHLPDEAAAVAMLEKLSRTARDFLFIRHPSFDDMDYLAQFGLKFGWTDWESHTNMMRIDDYRRIFAALGWTDYVIFPDMPIDDSSHIAVVPLSAPRDTYQYDEAALGPKPAVTFDHTLYGKYDIFVRLNPGMSDGDWNRVASMDGWRAVWE